MKKWVVFALALLLAAPAVTYAGSATSRWDLTIGGFVKFDMGWSDQGVGADYGTAARKAGSIENLTDKYGNLFMASGESRFNFLVKGPDAWGAKTSAFMEWDYRGPGAGASPTVPYGVVTMRHMYMDFAWANDSLRMGNYWVNWNYGPPLFEVAYNTFTGFKQIREPQIRWTHKFSPDAMFNVALTYPTKQYSSNGSSNVVDDTTRSMLPQLGGVFEYTPWSCGKIGPFPMTFGLAGAVQRTKITYNTGTAAAPAYSYQNLMGWVVNAYAYIPIIPEKTTDKGGALYIGTGGVASSNMTGFFGPFSPLPYNQHVSATDPQYQTPTNVFYWGSIGYYPKDNWQVAVIYMSQLLNSSSNYRTSGTAMQSDSYGGSTTVKGWNSTSMSNSFNFAVEYWANPAVRLAAEVSHFYNKFGCPTNATGTGCDWTTQPMKGYGEMNAGRFAAWYYF